MAASRSARIPDRQLRVERNAGFASIQASASVIAWQAPPYHQWCGPTQEPSALRSRTRAGSRGSQAPQLRRHRRRAQQEDWPAARLALRSGDAHSAKQLTGQAAIAQIRTLPATGPSLDKASERVYMNLARSGLAA